MQIEINVVNRHMREKSKEFHERERERERERESERVCFDVYLFK